MAVHYVKGSNPFSTIGTIASIAGMATGQPWLTALGYGANAYGNTGGSLGGGFTTPGFQNVNNNPLPFLSGLFSGNIASNPDHQSQRGK